MLSTAVPLLESSASTPKTYREFEEAHPVLLNGGLYEPPQLTVKGNVYKAARRINWYSHRSPFLNDMLCPCAKIGTCCLKTCLGFQEANIVGDDGVWKEMLMRGDKANREACPERLRGLFWMQDNTLSEVLITFQDANWSEQGNSVIKERKYNWTRDTTCWGVILTAVNLGQQNKLTWDETVQSRNDVKWINIGGIKWGWLYIPSANEELVGPDGKPVPFDPENDLVRYDFDGEDKFDSSAGLSYNYRLRRVAYLDENGTLVKTSAWDELKAQVQAPIENPGCLCDHCYCNLSNEQILENQLVLGNPQIFKMAPPPAVSMDRHENK